LPRVTKPTIGSGGAGLQHLASIVIRPSVPTTSTPDFAPCSTLDARLLLTTAASSGGGASPGFVQRRFHVAQAELLLADRDEQIVDLGEAELVRQRFQVDRGLALALQRFFDQRAPCASVSASSCAWNQARIFERVRLLTV
jgi:hypothetical protein